MILHQMHLYLWKTIWIVGNIILIFFFIRFFVIGIGVVDGSSMDPTMKTGQIFFVNKLIYLFHQPKLHDIIQAYRPDSPRELIVKRITAVPGDIVFLRDGSSILIPPYTYFVTGDNTQASTDSRDFGPVPRTLIKGRIGRK